MEAAGISIREVFFFKIVGIQRIACERGVCRPFVRG